MKMRDALRRAYDDYNVKSGSCPDWSERHDVRNALWPLLKRVELLESLLKFIGEERRDAIDDARSRDIDRQIFGVSD